MIQQKNLILSLLYQSKKFNKDTIFVGGSSFLSACFLNKKDFDLF